MKKMGFSFIFTVALSRNFKVFRGISERPSHSQTLAPEPVPARLTESNLVQLRSVAGVMPRTYSHCQIPTSTVIE